MSEKESYTYWVDSDDRELQAIEVLMSVLSGLVKAQRIRVLDYVTNRFVEEAQ